MLLAFVGDTHGRVLKMYERLEAWQRRTGQRINGVIQVGDFNVFLEFAEPFKSDFSRLWHGHTSVPIPTWVCLGNHEDHAAVRRWQSEPDRIPNLRLLPDGGVTDVLGVNIGAVWGNFSPKSWNAPQRIAQARQSAFAGSARSGRVAVHIDRLACDRLLASAGPMGILVTHDAPSCFIPQGFRAPMNETAKELLGLERDENPNGCPGFTAILKRFRPRHHFFGHYHVRDAGTFGPTRITCLHAFDMAPELAVEFVQF